jgi:5-methylcytosine-specific restriction endonuclease McrA
MAIDGFKRNWLKQILRRATYKWPPRWSAEKRSKLERNTYYCENPECGVIGPKRMFEMDHTIPCVDPTTGWTTLDSFADRLFCDAEGLVRLCIPCHTEKTIAEGGVRKETRRKKREKK